MMPQPEPRSWMEALELSPMVKSLLPVTVGVLATLLLPFIMKTTRVCLGTLYDLLELCCKWVYGRASLPKCCGRSKGARRTLGGQAEEEKESAADPRAQTQTLLDYLAPLHDMVAPLADTYLKPILEKVENVKVLLTNLLQTFQEMDVKATLATMTTQLETSKTKVLSEIRQAFQEADLKTKFSAITSQIEGSRNKLVAEFKQSFQDMSKLVASPPDLTANFAALKAQIEEVRVKLVAATQLAAQEIKQHVQGALGTATTSPGSTTSSTTSPELKECRDDLSKLAQTLQTIQDQTLQIQADIKLLNSRVSQGFDKASSEAASSHGTLNSQLKGNHSYMKGMKESLDSILHRTDAQEPRGWQVKHVDDMGKLGLLLAEIKEALTDLTERVDGQETSLVNLVGKLGRQENQAHAHEQKHEAIYDILKDMTGRLGRQENQTAANEQKWDAIFDVLKEMLDRMGARQMRGQGQFAPLAPNMQDPRMADMMSPIPGGLPSVRPIQIAPLVNQPYPQPPPQVSQTQQGPMVPPGPMSPAQRAEALRAALDYITPAPGQ